VKEPAVVTTEPVVVAVLRLSGSFAQIPGGYGRLYAWIAERGLHATGMPAAVYLSMPPEVPEEAAVFELWAPIADDIPDAEPDAADIAIRHEPATQALSAMHMGPYDTMGSTYEAMLLWMTEHGYAMDGPPMERYYSDPNEVPPEEYLTEVLIPVRKTP